MGAERLTFFVSLRRVGLPAPLATIAGAAILVAAGASGLRADDSTFVRAARPMQLAQSNGLPPSDVPGGQVDSGMDAGALVVRVDKLENQLRAANGAIEELQNQNRRLADQLKRFQEDVEFRLNGGHGAAPIAEAAPAAKPAKRSDAFDPGGDPNAAGAPRPLGTTTPSAPLAQTPSPLNAPLELSRNNPNPAAPGPLAEEPKEPTVITGPGGSPDEPREQFNAAYETYRAGQYEKAEQQFRAFLAKNASSKMAPDAVFFIGESFFKRSRPREAAEQYLKLSTDYAKSSRAPESMLRLGQSLAALGNNEQACATLGEVGKRYPRATATVSKSVEEMQKDHC
jgi:tol-pal system protein YbgF